MRRGGDLCVKAWGGAVGVGERGCAGWALGLAELAVGDWAVALFKDGADGTLGCFVGDEGLVQELREGLAREIAFGWAEAAGEDDERGCVAGAAERGDELGQVVGDGGELARHDAHRDEAIGEPLGVGVEELAGEEFVAGGEEDGGGVRGLGHA